MEVRERSDDDLAWVILTMGNRPGALATAVRSLSDDDGPAGIAPSHGEVVVVSNGAGSFVIPADAGVRVIESATNLGVPGGRDLGVRSTSAPVIGFLDDDAVLTTTTGDVTRAFADDAGLGAVSFRIVDEAGLSSKRHVPRPGSRHPDEAGPVAVFLGGASAIRREAYDQVGGFFVDLQYGHEEVELSWRLIDAGWQIRYLADIVVFHPRTEIGRHQDGWRLTGRNRVWIARRTLPWPVAIVHVLLWLIVGCWRTPDATCRRSYIAGWWSGWRTTWPGGSLRRPISWRGVWRLTRLGRPPVF